MEQLKKIDVSICIVNWNAKDLLQQCIQSIKERTAGVSYEIVIVDNNSQDGSVQMLQRFCPGCVVIDSRKNLGFAKGNNEAVKKASGKYILYLNPDTALITNAIRGMYLFLEKNPDFGAVGCKLVDSEGQIQFTCARTFPTPFNQFSYLALLNRVFPHSRHFSTAELGYWNHADSREIDCLSGACIMVRKQIIDALNGFDEHFFMYAEDVDLCYRIRKQSWKIYYLAEECVYHHEGASSKKRSNKYFTPLWQRASNYYFLDKHFGSLKAFTYKTAVAAGSIIRLFALIFLTPFLIATMPGKVSPDIFGKYFYLFLWSIGLKKIER